MAEDKKQPEKKGFFARLIDKLDGAMKEKAEGSCCGCGPKSKDGSKKSCC